MFEQNKIAKVFETCEGSECDGYLTARIDDQVEVLHYQSNAEADWVYARDAVYGRVVITSKGLVRLCDNSKDGGACIYVEDYILKDALHRLGEPHVDLVLDARNFPDPHGRKITSHPGFYPENMNRIVQNTEFKPYLEDISKKMAQSRYKTDGSTPRAAAANGDCRLLPRRLPLL